MNINEICLWTGRIVWIGWGLLLLFYVIANHNTNKLRQRRKVHSLEEIVKIKASIAQLD